MQQQQQIINEIDRCINGLVNMLVTYQVEIPTAIVNPDVNSDLEMLDKLLEVVQDNNLEYDLLRNQAIMKPIVKQSYLCAYQNRRGI